MHIIQEKILNLARERNIAGLALRKIGELVGVPDSPQKIKHHLDKLIEKGLLLSRADGKELRAAKPGLDKKTKIISLPIVGSANCGEALTFADEQIEGYLKVTPRILPPRFANRVKDLYVLKAIGNSMNRANINGKNIENGDYALIDRTVNKPINGEYVVSVIDGLSNIKRFHFDAKNRQIILVSESTQDLPPIYIHESDKTDYLICGKVVDVFKAPVNEEEAWQNASGHDALKELGEISQEESEYYDNL